MYKFIFWGHNMVVMKEDELKEMLIDANAKGYIDQFLDDIEYDQELDVPKW